MKVHHLHHITQETKTLSHQECALNALKGGVKWIQLRVKDKTEEEVFEIAKDLKAIASDFERVKLIMNDYLQITKELDYDGIHLGMSDTSTLDARKLLGKEKIVGGTANTISDILFHYKNGVDYVGLGPYTFTSTKDKLSPIVGVEGYINIIKELKSLNIEIPIVGIGGIKKEDFKQLKDIGLHGVALASLINLAKEPISKAEEIVQEIKLQWS
jgi:thiamine-phosphate pyrophosphorylase